MMESTACQASSNGCTQAHAVLTARSSRLRKAERLIESCEHRNEEDAQIPFGNILDRVTGSDPTVTDYILEEPAKCTNCGRQILEKTLVEPADE